MSIEMRLGRRERDAGMEPERELKERSSSVKEVSDERKDGTGPETEVKEMVSIAKCGRLPRADGMGPTRLGRWCSNKLRRYGRDEIAVGIVPVTFASWKMERPVTRPVLASHSTSYLH